MAAAVGDFDFSATHSYNKECLSSFLLYRHNFFLYNCSAVFHFSYAYEELTIPKGQCGVQGLETSEKTFDEE